MKIENPIPTPTNKDKFFAEAKGFDADYVPGMDDGEFIIRERLEQDRTDEIETAQELSKLGIW